MAINKNGSTPQFLNAALVPAAGFDAYLPAGSTNATYTGTVNLKPGTYAINQSGTSLATFTVNGTSYTGSVAQLTGGGTQIVITPVRTWTARTPAIGTAANFTSVGYNADATAKYVITTTTASTANIQTSTNGITWTNRACTDVALFTVAGGDPTNRWVVGGQSGRISSSTDGITWTTRTSNTTAQVEGLAYGANVYVAVGSNMIRSSTDGITWTTRTSGLTSGINAVNFGDGLFLMGGDNGVYSSTDGTTWTTRTINSAQSVIAIGAGPTTGNKYVVNGEVGTVRVSTDAITWVTRTTNLLDAVRGIDWTGSHWVAVSDSSEVATSTDAVTWSKSLPLNASDVPLKGVVFGNSIVVAVGNGSRIITDTNNGNGTLASDWGATFTGPLTDITLT